MLTWHRRVIVIYGTGVVRTRTNLLQLKNCFLYAALFPSFFLHMYFLFVLCGVFRFFDNKGN